MDVTDPESLAKNNPLRDLLNVIFSPHLASLTNKGLERIGKNATKQIMDYIAGETVDGEISDHMLAHMDKIYACNANP